MTGRDQDRISGGLIVGAVGAAATLMLHHPTSFKGPDDGLLLNDWSNTAVHGAMIVCLLALRFGHAEWAQRLGKAHLSVRLGAMLLDSGMTAFIAAALISGFAASGVAARLEPDDARLMLKGFVALNQALANLGMALTAAAMATWAVRMLRLDMVARIAGGLGLIAAVAAACWMIVGQGAFGLYPAVTATALFGLWSILIASQMMVAPAKEPAR
ncbi:MAG: hypothetical protein WC563_11355 [Brevundimonas sp.]|uniref:hypothetical protein n=1 Tax=Brevundimonas TaxID=41275 RepID=UPI0022AC4AF1|nr:MULTISPECIES: hypothetical protein [Brevundimonas]